MGKIRSRGTIQEVKQRSIWRRFVTTFIVLNFLGTTALLLKAFNLL